jgi:hypothetical protein
MKSNRRIVTSVTALAFGLFLALPSAAFGQTGYWGQNDRRRDRREERREDRQERRDERREERQERREARRGFGWGNYGGWGGSAQLRQTALNAGYNQGIREGRNDQRRGERFNFTDESDYRSASRDYSSRLGDRSLYQRFFRHGFENGYRDGWNGY